MGLSSCYRRPSSARPELSLEAGICEEKGKAGSAYCLLLGDGGPSFVSGLADGQCWGEGFSLVVGGTMRALPLF